MIDSVLPVYRREASISFQIALHDEQDFNALNPLRFLDLFFLDAAGTDSALAWQPAAGATDDLGLEAILIRLDSTLRKLKSRCLGSEDVYEPPLQAPTEAESLDEAVFLPIIHDVANVKQHKLFSFDFSVDFLHRSLRDFMVSDGLRLLRPDSSFEFDSWNFLHNTRFVQAQQFQPAGFCGPLTTVFCSYVLSTLGVLGYRTFTVSRSLATEYANPSRVSLEVTTTFPVSRIRTPDFAPQYRRARISNVGRHSASRDEAAKSRSQHLEDVAVPRSADLQNSRS